MKRIISGVAIAMLGLVPIGTSTSAETVQAPLAGALVVERTDFAFSGNGYATLVRGGTLPVDSGKTALSVLSCTNLAPRLAVNRVATADLAPLPLTVTNLRTTNESVAVAGGFATVSESRVGEVQVGTTGTGLKIEALRTKSTAAFVNGVAQPKVEFFFASATLAGVSVSPTLLQQGVTVPGVGTVQLGWKNTGQSANHAAAHGRGLMIVLNGTPTTTVTVGEAFARIDKGAKGGIFGGGATVARGNFLEGDVLIGPLANQRHHCLGTNGEWLSQNIVDADLQDVGRVEGGRAAVRSDHYTGFSSSRSHAFVEKATIGPVTVEGLVVKVFTKRNADGTYERNAIGTTVGRILVNGTVVNIAPGGTITVPGVAKITSSTYKRLSNGVDVTGVRIELLSGDLAIVELGRATAIIA